MAAYFRMFLEAYRLMEAAVRQYEMPLPQMKLSGWKKLLAFFSVVFLLFAFRWSIDSMFHWKHQTPARALMVPVAIAITMIFRPFPWQSYSRGSLILGDDFIEGRTQTGLLTFKKHIRRDQIKSIVENRRGLTIMDRSEFAARMLGFVFVPATMPEYQEIRTLLLQWAPPNSRLL
jgi:hypothetical protein